MAISESGQRGLRQKIVELAKLSVLMFSSQLVLRLVSTVVLTRLLMPEAYGVFAIVMMYAYILGLSTDMGIKYLILTKEGEVDDRFLRTCWTFQILRGAIIALLCVLIAALIAWGQSNGFFKVDSAYMAPVLPYAIAAFGGVMLIYGLELLNLLVYERRMQFRRVALSKIATNALALLITVCLAIMLRSVWALVLGSAATAIIQVAFSFMLFHGPAMWPQLDRNSLGIIIDRGKWIMSHSVISAMVQTADRLCLGFVFSASTFGFYYIGAEIVSMVRQFLNSMHQQMGIQVFTELTRHNEGPSFRSRYYRYRVGFDVLALTAAGALIVLAPMIVHILYDDRYQSIAVFIQILSLGLILIGPSFIRSAFAAERRFKRMTLFSLIQLVSIWGGLFVTIVFFKMPMAAVFVIALHRLPEILVMLRTADRYGWIDWWKEVRFLPLVFVGAALGWGAIWLLEYVAPQLTLVPPM